MRVFYILVAFVWVVAFANAQNGIRFTSALMPAVPSEQDFIAVEISGSGQKEVVASANAPARLVIRDFDLGTSSQVPITVDIVYWAAIDVDSDGDEDVVTCGATIVGPGATVAVFSNAGGTLALSSNFNVPTSGRILATDLDGDGDSDMVIGRAILLNDGTGSFSSAPPLTAAPTATEFLPGDYDGDGDTDLLALFPASTGTGIDCRVLLKTPGATYTVGPVTPFASETTGYFRIADMNGDGRSDVVRSLDVGVVAGEVRTFAASGAFGFTALPAFRFTNLSYLRRFDLADVDGDSILDFVGTAKVTANVDYPFVVLGDGNGLWNEARGPLFSEAFNGLMPIGPYVATDMNGDGYADVIGHEANGFGVLSAMTVYTNGGPVEPASAEPIIASVTPPQTAPTNFLALVTFILLMPSGAPAVGQHVGITVNVTSGNATVGIGAGADHAFTNDTGRASVYISTGTTPGQVTVTATTLGGQSVSSDVTIVPYVTITGGNLQTAHPGEIFAAPLSVRAFAATAATGPYPVVTFTSVGAVPILFESPASVQTNTANEASVIIRASLISGPARVRASTTTGQFVEFDLSVVGPPLLTRVSPEITRANIGEPIPPIVVHADDGNGGPRVGATLDVSVFSGTAVPTTQTVVTGSDGNATINLAPSTVAGASLIAVSANFGGVLAPVYVRALTITKTPVVVLVKYQHEHANTPLIIAGDLPLPAPGYVTSEFGNLATSILAPDAAFVALDGIGVFGPADPTVVTNLSGVWQRTFSTPPTVGLSFVLQVYGYDVEYAYPGNVFISNPATLNL